MSETEIHPDQAYPSGVCVGFFAEDADHEVAFFLNSLFGPMPKSLWGLCPNSPASEVEMSEVFGRNDDMLWAMPFVSECMERIDRSLWSHSVAKRGVYSYEWRSTQVGPRSFVYGNYERVGSPTLPRKTTEPLGDVAIATSRIRLSSIRFRQSLLVNIGGLLDCLWDKGYPIRGESP